MAAHIVTALAFSMLYVLLYPVVRGLGTFYIYPPLTAAQATAYVLSGILLQGWFCLERGGVRPRALIVQVVLGVLYAAGVLTVRGFYQS